MEFCTLKTALRLSLKSRSLADFINTTIYPNNDDNILSHLEISRMRESSKTDLKLLFKKCALAVLTSLEHNDDIRVVNAMLDKFDIEVIQRDRGLKLRITNAPAAAFVENEMILGIKEHLFSVLRDIIYLDQALTYNPDFNFSSSETITDAIFNILRNARVFRPGTEPDLVVCWGGHAISRDEYEYCKDVGYRLGLRAMNIITGCGPGAMKGPMKGALIGQSKQRMKLGRYIGITEPGIIAAESPNAICNELIIMPDIEKRLEAFIRLGHGIIIFPGGVGTMEEILYIMGILLDEKNRNMPFPVIFTGNKDSEDYLNQIDNFIRNTLGEEVCERYKIIINDPIKVAQTMKEGLENVTNYRKAIDDAFHFNWSLHIDDAFQTPFDVSHESMAALNLSRDQEKHTLAANLRRAFSGIVTGNVKEHGINQIDAHGPYILKGDPTLCHAIDELLKAFVEQKRMKLADTDYKPCYRIEAIES